MTYRSAKDFIDALKTPMVAPCGWGVQDEFKGVGGRNSDDVIEDHLEIHQLRPQDSNHSLQTRREHELCHLIYGVSLLVPPRSETMADKMYNATYQGDIYAENFVIAMEDTIKDMQLKGLAGQGSHITVDSIKDKIMLQMKNWCDEEATFVEKGNNGRKGMFYLGKNSDPQRSMYSVSSEIAYNEISLYKQAQILAAKRGEADSWEADIEDGSSYTVAGQRQTYKDVTNFADDPDAQVLVDRAAHVLFSIKDTILESDDVTEDVEMSDVYDGILESLSDEERNSPDLARFEAEFFDDPSRAPELDGAAP